MRKILLLLLLCLTLWGCSQTDGDKGTSNPKAFRILCSSENKDLEQLLLEFGESEKIEMEITYAGTIDIMHMLNQNPEAYDAVWPANSIWLYMLDNPSGIKYSKITSINPVVFGIRKDKADALGFTAADRTIYMEDIVTAINEGELKFIMPSATQTNSGASAFLGFINYLSGTSATGILTMDDLGNPQLRSQLRALLKGAVRTSGDEAVAGDIFLGGDYDAIINYEASLLKLNQEMAAQGMEPLYLVYPYDGVSLSDSPFAYVDNGSKDKEEQFHQVQDFLLSAETQKSLLATGRRTEYGGLIMEGDSSLFQASWGIKTDEYLSPIRYPSSEVIREALYLYQNELKRPSCIVFCLDYSGSMEGEGYEGLAEAMEFILDYSQAAEYFLQFSPYDSIYVLPFSGQVEDVFYTGNGTDTDWIRQKIEQNLVGGGTNIYLPVIEALEILQDYDPDEYTRSIVLMTDGQSEEYSRDRMMQYYDDYGQEIPIFSIMFGEADESQLQVLAQRSNGLVVDGAENLLEAFKAIRGYN